MELNEKLMKITEGITPDNLDSSCDTLLKCGIISIEEETQIRAYMMEKEREELINQHDYHIYQGKDGKWYVYVKEGDKRKRIKRKTKEEIQDIVIKYVKAGQAVTVADIFYEWLNRQLENESISRATFNRYKATFKRHFEFCGWDKKRIDRISANEWSDWIEDEMARMHLTAKGYSGLKLVVRSIIKRAKRKGLITYNASDVTENIEKKPYKVHKSDESQILSKEDLAKLLEYLRNNPTTQNLALLFLILSGVRVGELVTLKYDDFISDTCAEIKRTETCFKGNDGKYHYEVKESPKTEAGFRKVFIPTEYSWIIRKMRALSPFAEYICTDKNGERMTAQNLRSKMYRVCEKIGIDKKSPHKARKTFASIVKGAGAKDATVISIMGHTDISTTNNHYDFNRDADTEKQNLLDNIVEFKQAINA